MTFEEVYAFTDRISSPTAFDKEESRGLYGALALLNPGTAIMEIGCEFGRSTSILAQVANLYDHELFLIEWKPRLELITMLAALGARYTLHAMKTSEIAFDMLPTVSLLHIDGDHDAEGVEYDCLTFLPFVEESGFACFHDYGRDSLPHVKPVVDKYTKGRDWSVIGTFGTLHIVRKRIK